MKKSKKICKERIANAEPFIDKYNQKGRNYSSEEDDWKRNRKKSI